MNFAALTDHKLSKLRQQTVQEIERRTKAASDGLDPAAIIYGNEMAKRALIVAAAGSHSVLFVGPPNCGKSMMRAAALELGLTDTFEAQRCPCGNRSDPRAVCNCTVRRCERHLRKLPVAEITVEMMRPTKREIGVVGTTLYDMREQIVAASDHTSTELDRITAELFDRAASEMNFDIPTRKSVLVVARTIANLDQSERIQPSHLMEAVNYRPLSRLAG